MTEIVIDTNVLLVANGAHEHASEQCMATCIERLEAARSGHLVVIDDGHRILGEYGNKLQANQAKGVGDAFLKWLLQNSSNPRKVAQVSITDLVDESFAEFPEPPPQCDFDPPDRKFVAVSNAHPSKPRIWQATDCKWLDWWQALAEKEIHVDFICAADVCGFYRTKFPEKHVPPLP
jgi:hypothetical protein